MKAPSSTVEISQQDVEKFLLHDNAVGIVDVHEEHAPRVAELLAIKHPGVVILWDKADKDSICSLSAIWYDRRAMTYQMEKKLVSEAQAIAHGSLGKHAMQRMSFWKRLFHRPLHAGYRYKEPSKDHHSAHSKGHSS